MTLTFTDNHFVFQCAFNEKHIPKNAGFRWNPERKQWTSGIAVAARALEKYADDAAKSKLHETQKAVDQSRATGADYAIPVPEGLDYLAYQKAGIAYAFQRWCTLFGDQMGLGKTIQAVGLMNAIGQDAFPAIIVCPAHLRINWHRELAKWSVNKNLTAHVAWNNELPIDDDGLLTWPDVLIINYDKLNEKWMEYICCRPGGWGTAIVDEIHYAKNTKTKRAQSVFGTKEAKGVYNVAKRCIALTGTLLENKVIDVWPICHAFAPEVFPDKYKFIMRYCAGKMKMIPVKGGGKRKTLDFSGSSNLAELQEKMREHFMVRRLFSEVMKDMPAKRRQLIVIRAEDNETQTLISRQWALAGLSQTATDEEIAGLVEQMETGGDIAFSDMAKIRAALAEPKAKIVAEFAREALEEPGKQLVLYCHHKAAVYALANELQDYAVGAITGETPQHERQPVADMFVSGELRVLICSLEAASTGLNLQNAHHVMMAEAAWKPSTNQQAEGRVYRIGQTRGVLIQYFAFDGSIDARVMELNIKKQDMADAVLDNRSDGK